MTTERGDRNEQHDLVLNLMPGCLKWRGDQTGALGAVLGPTTYGAPVTVASVSYDEATDVTTVRTVIGHDRPYQLAIVAGAPRFVGMQP